MDKLANLVSVMDKLGIAHATQNVGALILGGHFQGLGTLRSLGRHGVPVCLIDHDFCIGRFSKYTKKFIKGPSIRQELQFFTFLKDLARKEKLEGWVIYPSDDETVSFLARKKRELEKYYTIPTPSWEITCYASEKKLTYQLAEKYGIPTPRTFYPGSTQDLEKTSLEFPVILKPSVKEPFYSLTKKKAIRVNNRQELLKEFAQIEKIYPEVEVMVQEFIPGGTNCLFSVGSFFKAGEFLGKVVAKRIRQHPMDFGHATTYAITVDVPELEQLARRFLRAMGYYGLSEIEFMLDTRDGKYKLIEMNARTWGWHTLAINAGVDLPYLLYQDILGQKTSSDGFAKGIKWCHLMTDIPTVLGEIRKGRMSVSDYLKSLKGTRNDAVLSVSDPLPFVMEVLMSPYLWMKRGF